MIKKTEVGELFITHEHDYTGTARITGKDAHGNDIDVDIEARLLVELSHEVLKQHGEMFPTIRVERVGPIGCIEINGDAGRMFDLLEKMLTAVKQRLTLSP